MGIKRFLFCGAVFVFGFFSMCSFSAAEEELTSLEDVDLVQIGGHVKDGVLKIQVFYKNRDEDKLVFWKKGKVHCDCELYEDVGKGQERQKIMPIKKEVKRHGQDFYADVPERYLNKGKKGIIECVIDTGYKKLKATKDLNLGN